MANCQIHAHLRELAGQDNMHFKRCVCGIVYIVESEECVLY